VRSVKGFAIIETLIAVVILGILATTAVIGFTSSRLYVTSADHHYQALNRARNRLEDIISGGAAPVAGTETIILDANRNLSADLIISYVDVNTIEVRVAWTETAWGAVPSEESLVYVLP
jgi:prepilin-type N-terminal cleavage/methylation domain-containing protein